MTLIIQFQNLNLISIVSDQRFGGVEVVVDALEWCGEGRTSLTSSHHPRNTTIYFISYKTYQLEAVERPTPRERMVRGKISPMTIQAQGPQVVAKTEMFKQMKAIMARTAFSLTFAGSVVLPAVAPMIPTMNCMMTIPAAPQMRMVRRPIFSTMTKEAGVESTLTRVVTMEIRKGSLIVPSCWKKMGPK